MSNMVWDSIPSKVTEDPLGLDIIRRAVKHDSELLLTFRFDWGQGESLYSLPVILCFVVVFECFEV